MDSKEDFMQEVRDNFLTCRLCNKDFSKPKTLPCMHSFCYECLVKYADESRQTYRFASYCKPVLCPVCKKRTDITKNDIDALPDNFLITSLTSIIRDKSRESTACGICTKRSKGRASVAVQRCIDCNKLLCKRCTAQHRATRVTQHHTIYSLDNCDRLMCEDHSEEAVRFICRSCSKCVCVFCTYTSHKGHDLMNLTEGSENYQQEMEKTVEVCKERVHKINEQLSFIHSWETSYSKTRENIIATATEFLTHVESQRQAFLSKLDSLYGHELLDLIGKKDALLESLDGLTSACKLSNVLPEAHSIESLLIHSELQNKVRQLLEVPLPVQHSIQTQSKVAITFEQGGVCLGSLQKQVGAEEPLVLYEGDDHSSNLWCRSCRSRSRATSSTKDSAVSDFDKIDGRTPFVSDTDISLTDVSALDGVGSPLFLRQEVMSPVSDTSDLEMVLPGTAEFGVQVEICQGSMPNCSLSAQNNLKAYEREPLTYPTITEHSISNNYLTGKQDVLLPLRNRAVDVECQWETQPGSVSLCKQPEAIENGVIIDADFFVKDELDSHTTILRLQNMSSCLYCHQPVANIIKANQTTNTSIAPRLDQETFMNKWDNSVDQGTDAHLPETHHKETQQHSEVKDGSSNTPAASLTADTSTNTPCPLFVDCSVQTTPSVCDQGVTVMPNTTDHSATAAPLTAEIGTGTYCCVLASSEVQTTEDTKVTSDSFVQTLPKPCADFGCGNGKVDTEYREVSCGDHQVHTEDKSVTVQTVVTDVETNTVLTKFISSGCGSDNPIRDFKSSSTSTDPVVRRHVGLVVKPSQVCRGVSPMLQTSFSKTTSTEFIPGRHVAVDATSQSVDVSTCTNILLTRETGNGDSTVITYDAISHVSADTTDLIQNASVTCNTDVIASAANSTQTAVVHTADNYTIMLDALLVDRSTNTPHQLSEAILSAFQPRRLPEMSSRGILTELHGPAAALLCRVAGESSSAANHSSMITSHTNLAQHGNPALSQNNPVRLEELLAEGRASLSNSPLERQKDAHSRSVSAVPSMVNKSTNTTAYMTQTTERLSSDQMDNKISECITKLRQVTKKLQNSSQAETRSATPTTPCSEPDFSEFSERESLPMSKSEMSCLKDSYVKDIRKEIKPTQVKVDLESAPPAICYHKIIKIDPVEHDAIKLHLGALRKQTAMSVGQMVQTYSMLADGTIREPGTSYMKPKTRQKPDDSVSTFCEGHGNSSEGLVKTVVPQADALESTTHTQPAVKKRWDLKSLVAEEDQKKLLLQLSQESQTRFRLARNSSSDSTTSEASRSRLASSGSNVFGSSESLNLLLTGRGPRKAPKVPVRLSRKPEAQNENLTFPNSSKQSVPKSPAIALLTVSRPPSPRPTVTQDSSALKVGLSSPAISDARKQHISKPKARSANLEPADLLGGSRPRTSSSSSDKSSQSNAASLDKKSRGLSRFKAPSSARLLVNSVVKRVQAIGKSKMSDPAIVDPLVASSQAARLAHHSDDQLDRGSASPVTIAEEISNVIKPKVKVMTRSPGTNQQISILTREPRASTAQPCEGSQMHVTSGGECAGKKKIRKPV